MLSVRRRRAFRSRSKNGCQSCKMRHMRCDEGTPACLNCRRRNLPCSFPSVSAERIPPFSAAPARLAPAKACGSGPSSNLHSNSHLPIRLSLVNTHSAGPESHFSGPHDLFSAEAVLEAGTLNPSIPSRAISLAIDGYECHLPEICELCSPVNYVPPVISGLDPRAVKILHYFPDMQATLLMPLMPAVMYQGASTNYYTGLSIGCRSDFVKNSLVYVSSMLYIQLTGHTNLKCTIMGRLDLTLKGLQQAVDNFSSESANAILYASTALAFLAPSWQEWTSYVAGWTAVLRCIDGKPITELFYMSSRRFWLKLSKSESVQSLPTLISRRNCRIRMEKLLSSMVRTKEVLRKVDWRAFGFEALEALVLSLNGLDTLSSIDDVFVRFTCLRTWMFCLETFNVNRNHLLDKLMRVHFYVLLSAVRRYFPPKCSVTLRQVCKFFIEEGQKDFKDVSPKMKDLAAILWDEDIIS